jgi:ferritin-like metal-binding protein YciE
MCRLQEMLIRQLRDAFSAEKQAIQCMKRTLRKISGAELKEGTQAHIEQSEEQRERVEQALQQLGSRPDRTVCEAMRGLVEEAQHEAEEFEKGPLTDLAIVASLQRIEHYEIAAYGTMAELANALEETEIAELLGKTLAEEKAQDEKLTEVARRAIMPLALEEEMGEEDESEEEEDEKSRETRKSVKSGSSRRTASASRR